MAKEVRAKDGGASPDEVRANVLVVEGAGRVVLGLTASKADKTAKIVE